MKSVALDKLRDYLNYIAFHKLHQKFSKDNGNELPLFGDTNFINSLRSTIMHNAASDKQRENDVMVTPRE